MFFRYLIYTKHPNFNYIHYKHFILLVFELQLIFDYIHYKYFILLVYELLYKFQSFLVSQLQLFQYHLLIILNMCIFILLQYIKNTINVYNIYSLYTYITHTFSSSIGSPGRESNSHFICYTNKAFPIKPGYL